MHGVLGHVEGRQEVPVVHRSVSNGDQGHGICRERAAFFEALGTSDKSVAKGDSESSAHCWGCLRGQGGGDQEVGGRSSDGAVAASCRTHGTD